MDPADRQAADGSPDPGRYRAIAQMGSRPYRLHPGHLSGHDLCPAGRPGALAGNRSASAQQQCHALCPGHGGQPRAAGYDPDHRDSDLIGKPLTVALIQADIEQSRKWDPAHIDYTLATYRDMTYAQQADLVLWPETAVPVLSSNAMPFVQGMAANLAQQGTTLITGI